MRKLLKEMGSVFDVKEISNMLSGGLADEDTDGSSDADLGNVIVCPLGLLRAST